MDEISGVRRAVLDLARALFEVATGTLVTAATATFMLVNEAAAKVRKQVRNEAG